MRLIRLAFSFLTVLPVGPAEFKPGDLSRAAQWFPWVGLILGVILGGAHIFLAPLFPPILCAALIVALWALLTGGLHLDGLADCCDGLAVMATPERRLEIMRDPRLGAFGTIGLTVFLIMKVAAVSALQESNVLALPILKNTFALVFAPVVARWLILIVASQPSARPGGMGAEFSIGLSFLRLLAAAILPVALTVVGGSRALLAVSLAFGMTWIVIAFARRRIGGVTGDVYGLAAELFELTVLLIFAVKRTPQ